MELRPYSFSSLSGSGQQLWTPLPTIVPTATVTADARTKALDTTTRVSGSNTSCVTKSNGGTQ